ncbi:MAG: hypothetical protein IPM97_15505 [Bdellovibrionaceae bacterium]|nr:hypothetical protein [Pseudobdellovibrionaceae bacterium]
MKYFLFLVTTLLITQASAKRDGVHAYVAMGITYTPSSFRVGYMDWEFGMLNRVFGFDKIFDIDNNFYSNLGFVYTPGRQPGVFTSMGWKAKLWVIPFRSELAAYMDFTGNGYASGLIGVSYGF